MRSLLPSTPPLTACTGRESSYYSCRLTRSSTARKLAEIIEGTGSSTSSLTAAHHKSRVAWEVWTLSALGVLVLLLLASYAGLRAMRRRRRRRAGHESESPCKSSPLEPVMEAGVVEDGERRSAEMVFFVEEEERFGLDELLGGVADLRMQGFCSGLYTVRLGNGAVYAVKRLKKVKVSFEEFGEAMRRIGDLRHPNILPLVCYNSDADEKLLIYRYQRNGSLLNLFENYIEGKRTFPWKLRLSLALGIARGLHFMHHTIIIPHGNLKLSNIMLTDNEDPMISEYGCTQLIMDSGAAAAKAYAPPERTVSEKGDVYSFGVVMLELLTGKVAEKSSLDLPRWVGSVVREECAGGVFDGAISGAGMYAFPLLNLALKCAARDPDGRPEMGEVVEKIEEVANTQGDVCCSMMEG